MDCILFAMNRESLRNLRHVLGLSQERFAQLVGVSVRTIARWEAGDTIPSPLAERQLASLERLHHRLTQLLRPGSIDEWMTRPHPRLGRLTPRQVLLAEGPEPLERLLDDIPSAFEGTGGDLGGV